MDQPAPVDDLPEGSGEIRPVVQVPGAPPPAEPTMDDDLDAIQPTSASRAGGGLLALTGGFTVVLALQTWLIIVHVPIIVKLLVVLMTLLGPTQVYLGWKITRMSGWAAEAGTACGAMGAAISLVWAVYALLLGVLSLLSVLLVPVSTLAAVFTAASIGVARAADRARARLAKHGMDIGT